MVIAGQGSCGLEFASQVVDDIGALDHLICCAGGGGLVSGIALAFEGARPETKVWTAEPEHHDDWKRSLDAGEIRANKPGTHSACDAILTPEPGSITWQIGSRLLHGGCVVSDAQVFEAMRLAFRHLKIVVEPGGAAALAAALFALPEGAKGSTVGVVLTGGNVDMDLYTDVLAGRKD
jgi:threonine dehydratase